MPKLSPPVVTLTAFALAKLVVHALWLRPYGWFRDELYYIACSEHLAWGYVDHPPLSVALLKAWRLAFGDSLVAIRLGPAIAGSLVVAFTGIIVIELGGGAVAVALACLAVLVAPAFLGAHHTWSMNVFDHLAWIVMALLAVRAFQRDTPRAWVALGVALGLALLNKWSVLWLGAGLVVGIVLSPARGRLARPWPYIAAAIALAVFAPHVAWEVKNGWPTLEFMKNALGQKYVPLSPLAFLREQLPLMSPLSLPLTLAGLAHAARQRKTNDGAFVLGAAFVTTLAILLVSKGAKPEYLVAAYPMLFACGAVLVESWLARIRSVTLRATSFATYTAVLVATSAVIAPFALPVLSEGDFIRYQAARGVKPSTSEKKELAELPQHYADQHGWPELVAAVGAVWATLSEADRARATLFAGSGGYGPAAALDFFGPAYGLPPARASHNNYWLWGPGDGDGSVVVLVGGEREDSEPLFESIEQVATFECRYCMPYEDHKPIYVARGLKTTFTALWPKLRHYE